MTLKGEVFVKTRVVELENRMHE